MRCPVDFYDIASAQTRATIVLHAAHEWDIHPDVAKALVALSEGETGYHWLTRRPVDGDEGCCAVVVGLEASFLDSVMKRPGAQKTASFIQENGFAQLDDETGLIVPANGFGNPLKPQKTMLVFEHTVKMREHEALSLYSLGPTQLHQHYFQKTPGRCGDPASWEELWDFYVAGSSMEVPADAPSDPEEFGRYVVSAKIAYLIKRWLRYLVPKRFDAAGCLSENAPVGGFDKTKSVTWLTSHAGNPTTAEKVWDGFGNRRGFKVVYPEVVAMYDKMIAGQVNA